MNYTFHLEVWLLVAFCVWLGFYVSRGLAPRWAGSDSDKYQGVSKFQKTAYAAAVFFLWLASDWPLHDLSEDYLYFAHMIQHLLITFVVPPLLLLATPEPLARTVLGGHPDAAPAPLFRKLAHPVLAGVAFNVVVAATHLPWVVNTAADNGPFHYFAHFALFGFALLMWMPVCGPIRELRLGLPAQMAYLFAMSILPTIPAGFLTFAEGSIYEAYTGAFGISATSDQQAAGLIMKIVGGFYLWTIIAVLFFRWSAANQKSEQRVRLADTTQAASAAPTSSSPPASA